MARKKKSAAKTAPKPSPAPSDDVRDSSEDGSLTAVGMPGQRKAHPKK